MRRREGELAKNAKLKEYNQAITTLGERGIVRILSPEEACKAADLAFQSDNEFYP